MHSLEEAPHDAHATRASTSALPLHPTYCVGSCCTETKSARFNYIQAYGHSPVLAICCGESTVECIDLHEAQQIQYTCLRPPRGEQPHECQAKTRATAYATLTDAAQTGVYAIPTSSQFIPPSFVHTSPAADCS